MVDFAELTRPGGYHYPEEVYLAAVGKPRKLARRILENEKLPPNERRALSAFLMGELLPPKRKRGQKRLAYLTTIENVNERLTLDAVLDYHHIMREVNCDFHQGLQWAVREPLQRTLSANSWPWCRPQRTAALRPSCKNVHGAAI